MFEVGGAELLIIALVAVIVLGPERLPKAARFAGLWVRRARAQWYSVKAELERELAAEDLKRQFTEPMAQLRPQVEQFGKEMRESFDGLDPGLPARVDLRPQPEEAAAVEPATPAPEAAPTPLATEVAEAAPAPAPDADPGPTTGDLFGAPPRP